MRKKLLLLIAQYIALIINIQAQLIHGRVIDEKEVPVAFVNVTLMSIPDSLFFDGTITDMNGNFSIDKKSKKNTLIRLSCIGYLTQYITDSIYSPIILQKDTKTMEEIIVKGGRPNLKMTQEGLIAKIENTVYSSLGTANDVLSQLPFIKGEKGEFSVFGRGRPLIYLNNRLIRDSKELQQLKSAEIKEVKIILNPGSQYESSVGAVIHISTLKPVGEGFGGTLYLYLEQNRLFSSNENVKLNYRKGSFDIFGGIDYGKYRFMQNQSDIISIAGIDRNIVIQNLNLKNNSTEWSSNIGFNYSPNSKNYFGIRYDHAENPSKKFDINGNSLHYINNLNDNSYFLNNTQYHKSYRNYINTYTDLKIKKSIQFHLDVDYLIGYKEVNQVSVNNNLHTLTTFQANSNSGSDYSLYAAKSWINFSLLGGKVSIGTEHSFTKNYQYYTISNDSLASMLPATNNLAKQQLSAGFATYAYGLKKISLQAGIRAEYIDYKYYNKEVLSNEQSKKYKNLFPSFSIAYQNSFSMSLSYKNIVKRPSYDQLRSSTSYYDPYSYEGGNPYLKPCFTNKLTYLFQWKDLQADVSYSWIKDNIILFVSQFNNSSALLFTTKNLPQSNIFSLNTSYSPKFSWWKPTIEVGLNKQNLIIENESFNKPIIYYSCNNIFSFPKNYIATLNLYGNSSGNRDIAYVYPNFRADVKLSKAFLNKNLNISISATNIFGSSKEKWETKLGNITFYKLNDKDLRGVYLEIIYRFNTSTSKYKGQRASEEMKRL